MKSSLFIAKVSGIRIYIHWTFLILIGYILFIDLQQGKDLVQMGWSVGFILAIFLCVTLHELGHALAAQRYHINTRNITLLPIGGVANLESMPTKPGQELVVAFAGPLVNFIIAFLLLLVTHIPSEAEMISSLSSINGSNFLFALLSVNITLALFNLIPAFPMDGGRVFRAILSFKMERQKATRVAASVGQVIAVGFIFLGFYGNPFLVVIGLFIFLGAQGEARYTLAQSILQHYQVKDVTLTAAPTIEVGQTLREAAQRLLTSQNRNFIVLMEGQPVGTLSRDEIIQALGKYGETARIEQAMDAKLLYLNEDMSLEEAYKEMQIQKKVMALVKRGEELAGAVDLENIIERIMIDQAKTT